MADRLDLEQMQELLSEALAVVDKISKEAYLLKDECQPWMRPGDDMPMKMSIRYINRLKKNIDNVSRNLDEDFRYWVTKETPR